MPITVLMCWKDFSPECGVLCALSKLCQKPCIFYTNYNWNVSLRSFSWIWCGGIFKWFFKSSVKSHRLHFWLLSTVSFQMRSQIPCLNKCEITLAAFVWPFPGVCFQMSRQIACMNPHWLHLIFLHYNVFPNVSSLWEYFDLQGPWRKVLADLKKSLYTLQADPEKSRDFMLKNPGILIDWKSRDPGIPGIPLGPGCGEA